MGALGLAVQSAYARSPAAAPTPLMGRIVRVTDGDTVVLLDAMNVRHKLRLAGIDAPELRMPYGGQARQHLANLVFGKDVLALVTKRDRYGRAIATVMLRGEDANLQMLEVGLAWHYTQFALEQAGDNASRYLQAEQGARMRFVGLWTEARPIAPWDWRAMRKVARQVYE